MYIYLYLYIYIYTNLPVKAIVGLTHPRREDSQGQANPHMYLYIYKMLKCQMQTPVAKIAKH